MNEAPTGRWSLPDGLWKAVSLLLLTFMVCAAFLSLPAGAKLTGEYALRVENAAMREEIRRLRADYDRLIGFLVDNISEIKKSQEIERHERRLMSKDIQWQTKWLQAAGRK